jgi:choline dehydrogenase-like flavoprotein
MVSHRETPMKTYEVVFIGTGMGGGALAYAVRDPGRKIFLLERAGLISRFLDDQALSGFKIDFLNVRADSLS